jgi:hypothetical protein
MKDIIGTPELLKCMRSVNLLKASIICKTEARWHKNPKHKKIYGHAANKGTMIYCCTQNKVYMMLPLRDSRLQFEH